MRYDRRLKIHYHGHISAKQVYTHRRICIYCTSHGRKMILCQVSSSRVIIDSGYPPPPPPPGAERQKHQARKEFSRLGSSCCSIRQGGGAWGGLCRYLLAEVASQPPHIAPPCALCSRISAAVGGVFTGGATVAPSRSCAAGGCRVWAYCPRSGRCRAAALLFVALRCAAALHHSRPP